MKNGNENRSGAQVRTSMKDKNRNRNARHDGRPNPSQNTLNANRGLNEDEQKTTTNQQEEEETTNAYTESSQKTNGRISFGKKEESARARASQKHDLKQKS